MKPALDPRQGDVEDDASSPKSQSMLALAGSMLVEISLPKLILAWTFLLVLPGLLLGVAPMIASAWLNMVSGRIMTPLAGVGPAIVLLFLGALAWFGARAFLRVVESSFWALASVVVQPAYAMCREGVRHLVEMLFPKTASQPQWRARMRSISSVAAGVIVCGLAISVFLAVWPKAELFGDIREIDSIWRLVYVALSNSVIVVSGYLAAGALIWAIADATMEQPQDFSSFHVAGGDHQTWRVAHISDIHIVGERYGFRIESGRTGPRGNDRLHQVFAELARIDAEQRLDFILITGDMTDAGRSAEWAEFFDVLALHPALAARVLVLPGNHDLNIVDRANPARMDLPTSPNRRLRQIRTLNAIAGVQGDRVRVIDHQKHQLGGTLDEAMQPYAEKLARFSNKARPRLFKELHELWNSVFPMVVVPDRPDGLGIILLNSNADTHFSFTNALGMISTEQLRGMEIAREQFPQACWIIGLHHHLVEYPQVAKAFSERIGTALINGNWFIRQLKPFARRTVLMHGHRHIDWIGRCSDLLIVSAPSPVMEARGGEPTNFYIHTLAAIDGDGLKLLEPEKITISGEA